MASTSNEEPGSGSGQTLYGGGRTRAISRHMITKPHPEIPRRVVSYVLDNWIISGIYTDPQDRESWVYFAFVSDLGTLVRVAVSMDDATIITAFQDGNATQAWNSGNRAYFERRLRNMEERNDPRGNL